MADESTANPQRTLSREQQLLVTELQGMETDFINLCRRIGSSRDLSLAITHMEDASLRAVRHILGGSQ